MSPVTSLVQRAARGMRALASADAGSGDSIARSRALASSVVESTAEAICAFDHEMRIIEWNPAMQRLTGLDRVRVLGRFGQMLELTSDWTAPGGFWHRALAGQETVLHDEPWGRRYGHRDTYVEGTIAPLRFTDGSVLGGVMTLRDVSERVRSAALLRESEVRFRSLFDQAAVGIVVLDFDDVIRDVNPAFVRLLGYQAAELLGRRSSELSPPDEEAAVVGAPLREILAGRRRSSTVERRFVRKDGEVRWTTFTVSCIEAFGSEVAVVGMAHDITERKTLESQLAHQAYHDALTGLANRALFQDRVHRAIAAGGEQRERVAVIYCDLDDFKKVNDSLGHAAGDRLLQVIAERLLNATRGCDTVARLGGDEFAILVANASTAADVMIVAERVVHSLEQPVALEGQEVFVGGSAGVVRCAPTDDAAALLRNADVAMYTAKRAGKGRAVMFEGEMHSAALERLDLETGLRRALLQDELRLRYQPIVELATGDVVGMEALVRWQHPDRGLLVPGEFLKLAEDTGLILPMGRWVLRAACREGAGWEARLRARDADPSAIAGFTLSVNVSARQLHEPDFVDEVERALADSGLTPGLLLLEITESVFLSNEETIIERMGALKRLGLRLAIDDFGTGFSSLSYLKRFPLDVLKIDRSFVEGVGRGGSDAALARAIIALGEVLSLRTVAEGVARPLQRERLQALGCQFAQGYLFAEPLTPEEVEALLLAAVGPHALFESYGPAAVPAAPAPAQDATRGTRRPSTRAQAERRR
jgi:diguanylate cyclase (GGDEF)-like protein/PAS domain S-box-containing protein